MNAPTSSGPSSTTASPDTPKKRERASVNVLPDGSASQCGRSADWGLLDYGNLLDRPLAEILRDEQIDQVVHVRQTPACKLFHGNIAVPSQCTDVVAGRVDVVRVAPQPGCRALESDDLRSGGFGRGRFAGPIGSRLGTIARGIFIGIGTAMGLVIGLGLN